MMNASPSRFSRIALRNAAAVLAIATLPAFAQNAVGQQQAAESPTEAEIRQFCTGIADAARDQRYLLQKQELENLQKDVDERIKTLEARRAEYEDWLKRRNDFLKSAEAGLVEIYKKMKPDAAAAQLAALDPEIASAIVMKLAPRQSSTILGEMPADKAAALTRILTAASDPNTSKDPS